MEIENLINNLNRAADDWEEKHPVTYTGNLRVQDALRDAASALSALQAENEKLRAELGKVKRERDAAIEYLREIEWCAGCKHFGGLDGCKKWAMGQCTGKHDLYEFIGPQKEG